MKKLTYPALGVALMLSSCSQDEIDVNKLPGDDNRIYFRSYFPSVSLSRAADVTKENLQECQVTCYNENGIADDNGIMIPYFADSKFENNDSGSFYSTESECIWPDANSKLHFFAYSPSAASMKAVSGDTCYNLANYCKPTGGTPAFDYRLEKFRVAKDIADQVDFIAAYAYGSLSSNKDKGIDLDFKHQLARVYLTAWGDNPKYDFEVAGVRIGNPYVQGDFQFSSLTSATDAAPVWQNTDGYQAPVEHIFGAGETVVAINKDKTSKDSPVSIMGKAGAAMVIPTPAKIEAWEGKADPATANPGYKTDKMYFSVLLRVKNRNGAVAYPYSNNEGMEVIYYAIDKNSRTINKRLYKIDGVYYTAPDKNEGSIYTAAADTEEICGFGWAALPVAAKWDAGKKYTYKLDYSDGIGWHDPADPEPGEPIIERSGVSINVNVSDWDNATDYDSDINVPKR